MTAMNTDCQSQPSACDIVKEFITLVRSGLKPEAAGDFMHPTVKAHQVISGKAETIERTPHDYSEHIEDFLSEYGQYKLEIKEIFAAGNKVYVRWQQNGKHIGAVMGYPPTGKELITVGSAVYRVMSGKIIEYWIQQENHGLLAQLKSNQH